MKALTINEVQHFTRGMNPKAAMGIGGVDLRDIIDDKRVERDEQLEYVKISYDQQWQNELREMLIGKKITAYMQRLASFDTNTMESKVQSKTDTFTIEVADVSMEKLNDSSIVVADTNNIMYAIRFETHDTKIYIEG